MSSIFQLVIALFIVFLLADAFTPAIPSFHRHRHQSMLKMQLFQSFFQKKPSQKAIADLKAIIVASSRNTDNGMTASPSQQASVAQAVKALEALNPTKTISSSSKLNGNWKLLYTTNKGSSAGKLGPFVGKVSQVIDLSSKRYVNVVNLWNDVFEGKLEATWTDRSSSTWTVKFLTLTIKVLGFVAAQKSLIGAEGVWRNTYLDDDLRILYAIGGKNTGLENIYILAKAEQ